MPSENFNRANITKEEIEQELARRNLTIDKIFFGSVDAQRKFMIQEKQVEDR